MCPIFVIKFSGVSDQHGAKIPVFPLTLLVIVTTVRSLWFCYHSWWIKDYQSHKTLYFSYLRGGHPLADSHKIWHACCPKQRNQYVQFL